ncbi:hypothetical protein GYMLUDRAFT_600450 [Collybiopsis luxurians FD-317 M1]|uniref:Unplaced genomic scaffold GYMLUscaffold_26, whole genome shotgun sequence n=1 Tax=Collybiopsis luxurians FD-317 M1 TaxID=944289 RepID=A0A0D0CPD0_9AGAR|nr:hypothetical protein GYMLUDRAFT_600450 [Collybiopsis luxurians FD-317 M1]
MIPKKGRRGLRWVKEGGGLFLSRRLLIFFTRLFFVSFRVSSFSRFSVKLLLPPLPCDLDDACAEVHLLVLSGLLFRCFMRHVSVPFFLFLPPSLLCFRFSRSVQIDSFCQTIEYWLFYYTYFLAAAKRCSLSHSLFTCASHPQYIVKNVVAGPSSVEPQLFFHL